MAAITNYVTNPSWEVNTTGATATNATIARDSTVIPTGTPSQWSLKVTVNASAQGSVAVAAAGLTIGNKYVFSFYAKAQSGNGVDFGVSPALAVANPLPIVSPLKTGAPYQRRYMGFTATATSMNLVIAADRVNPGGDIFWIDNVAVTSVLSPYFDGNYPFSAWTGTANNSSSTNTAFDDSMKMTTDEAVIVNGLCLNTMAWNITSKSGRYNPAPVRGDDYSFPGVNGKTFVANKPIDSGTWPLSMFVLGANPDGTIPFHTGQRTMFEHNYGQILRQCLNNQAPVTIYVWHPSGGVRKTTATLIGNPPDVTLMMGGRRAELTLAFEILPGVWSDAFATTITGTPSAAWSNQSLTLTGLLGGTVAIDDSVITVTGPIVNPRITNAVTGTWVQFTGTVPAGQTWTVDCSAWTSTLSGTGSVLTATTHFGHPRFVLIDPGDTTTAPLLTLTGSSTTSATNLSVTATRKHWYA